LRATQVAPRFPTLADLQEDFSDLDIVQLEKIEAEIHEGQYHTGVASVVRLVAVR